MERGGKTEPWKKHSHSYKAQVNSPALLTSPCITSQLVNRANFVWPRPHVHHRCTKQVLVANTQSLVLINAVVVIRSSCFASFGLMVIAEVSVEFTSDIWFVYQFVTAGYSRFSCTWIS